MSDFKELDAIEKINPDDYVIGMVHLPPGSNSTDFLNISDPAVVPFLKKFFKKIAKNPELEHKKIIPSTMYQSAVYAFSTSGSDSVSYVPFIGKQTDGSYAIREFQVHKIDISRVPKNEEDCDLIELS